MKPLRSKLTYANVVATLSLFLVLAGGSALAANQLAKNSVGSKQIKNNAITAAKIKNGAVTGSKINLSTLGSVPNAAHATSANTASNAAHATSADTATNATHATSADNATNATKATTAVNAEQLGGAAAGAFAKSQLEALHVIGAAGQPAFVGGCTGTGFFQAPAFYKDPFGVVHLVGDIAGCTANSEIFTLPAGFRPLVGERFVIRKGDETTGTIRVLENGEVAIFSATEGSLTDIQFRTN
jgi:hypothetical protein